MSRSAHSKSTYRLKKLPKCSKCNKEMVLVMVSYENKKGNFWEWECFKCNKSCPKNAVKEEPETDEDVFLHIWCKNEEKRKQRERDTRKSMSNNKRK